MLYGLRMRVACYLRLTHLRFSSSKQGDSEDVIAEAIESCPVSCIHAVTLDELTQLESEVATDVINNKARLVGGSYTAEEKGGTPWLRLLARRARAGKGSFLGL